MADTLVCCAPGLKRLKPNAGVPEAASSSLWQEMLAPHNACSLGLLMGKKSTQTICDQIACNFTMDYQCYDHSQNNKHLPLSYVSLVLIIPHCRTIISYFLLLTPPRTRKRNWLFSSLFIILFRPYLTCPCWLCGILSHSATEKLSRCAPSPVGFVNTQTYTNRASFLFFFASAQLVD